MIMFTVLCQWKQKINCLDASYLDKVVKFPLLKILGSTIDTGDSVWAQACFRRLPEVSSSCMILYSHFAEVYFCYVKI